MKNSNENKYCYWVFYIQAVNGSNLVSETDLVNCLKITSEKYYFQKEKATAEHYQGCMKTHIRKRHSTLLGELVAALGVESACVQLDNMSGSWEQAKAYCTKEETRVGEIFTNELFYSGKDIECIDQEDTRFPWQRKLLKEILDPSETFVKDADDRTIMWVQDPKGSTGKSKLVKWCCVRHDDIVKISFGSATQLRSAIVSAGVRKVYFVDIPRTLGHDDSLNSVISAIEDLKNGFIVSAMYGKNQSLLLDPPHIIIFSNQPCPESKLSVDRWKKYVINYVKDLIEFNDIPKEPIREDEDGVIRWW